MATLAMSTANAGVTASGAATPAAGNAQHAVRTWIAPRLETLGAKLSSFNVKLSSFGVKLFAAIVESRKEQAMAAIERHDWRLATELRAQLRAEQQGRKPLN